MVKSTEKQRTFNNGQILNHNKVAVQAQFDQPGRKRTVLGQNAIMMAEDIALQTTSYAEVQHQFGGVGQKDWD